MRAALALLVLLAARPALAVSVSATIDPPRLAAGESADLAVTVDGVQNAPAPEIASPSGLQLQYVGPASQVSFTNGRMTASITHHYTVLAGNPGRYTIGPIAVTVDGTRYDAGNVTLQVTAAGSAPGGTAASGSDQLELRLTLPKTELYVHERVPVSVKLLVGAVRVGELQYPTVPGDGVALDKFPEPTQRREQSTRGAVQAVEFTSTLLPLRPGTIELGPATMSMSLFVQSRRRGGFFGGFFGEESRPIQVRSAPVALTVLPLPSEGRPADFGGAVGKFTFEVTASPTAVAAGDPVTVRSVVRGDGALDGIAAPAIAATDALRVYPIQAATPADAARERIFEQVVIPLRDGPLALPRLRFTYFDPVARAYRTIEPPAPALDVRASVQAKASPEFVGGTPAAPAPVQRPETLGRDLVFIKDAPGTLRPIGARRYASPLWWLAHLVPIGLFVAAAAYDQRRRRVAGDSRYARYTRAGRAARTALAGARAALAGGDGAGCHDAVAAAIRDYLAAKLDLPPGAVVDAAPVRLRTAGVAPEVVTEVAAFFEGCVADRFAPGGGARGDLERTLARAESIVRALERTRRLAPVAAVLIAGMALAARAVLADGEAPTALFFRGNALYSSEQYAEAASAYGRVLAAGVESAAVHFNAGNAYFKTGDVGRAVLAYERARRLAPGDPDLAANLAYARELASDVAEAPVLQRFAFPLASRLSTDALATAAAVAWWVLWLVLAAGRLWPGVTRIARGFALAAGIVLAVTASAAIYRWSTVDQPTHAVVVARADATVRFEPSLTGTAHFVAKPGTVLRVDGTREAWSQVMARDGRRGWVETSTLDVI